MFDSDNLLFPFVSFEAPYHTLNSCGKSNWNLALGFSTVRYKFNLLGHNSIIDTIWCYRILLLLRNQLYSIVQLIPTSIEKFRYWVELRWSHATMSPYAWQTTLTNHKANDSILLFSHSTIWIRICTWHRYGRFMVFIIDLSKLS